MTRVQDLDVRHTRASVAKHASHRFDTAVGHMSQCHNYNCHIQSPVTLVPARPVNETGLQ